MADIDTETHHSLADFEVILVGCGRMGSALATGWAKSGHVEAGRLICLDADTAKAERLARSLGASAQLGTTDIKRIWVIAVKPGTVADVLRTYSDRWSRADIVVSIAAGVTTDYLRQMAGDCEASFARAMPNTPALVGRGVTGLMVDHKSEIEPIKTLFESVGHVVVLNDEAQFDALTGLSGSGPAYIFVAIEALADAGVLMGLSRDVARELAVHTVGGAAALVESDPQVHTAELKDRVASPGGTTIRGLAALEANGFRHALIQAVQAAAEHSRRMREE